MSILFIKNAYCCGHGDIVHRLENYCIAKKIKYKKTESDTKSYAILGDKSVELKPTLSLSQVLLALGLEPVAQSSRS